MASSPGSVTRRRTSSIHDEIKRLQSQLSGGLTNREVLDENANALKRPEEDLERLKRGWMLLRLFLWKTYFAELEEEGAAKANLFRILKYAKPETPYLLIATIAAIVQGGVFPVFSLFFSRIIEVDQNGRIIWGFHFRCFRWLAMSCWGRAISGRWCSSFWPLLQRAQCSSRLLSMG